MPANQPDEITSMWQAAFNSGNVESIMPLYESDAVLVPQPGQMVRGAAAIREALLGFLSLKLPISMEAKRILTSGDVAMVSNTWTLSGTGPDGSAVNLGGNTMEVWRRQTDGTWRCIIDDPYGTV
jgi:uncharacterized protein (TIGR02246 family)